MWRKIRHALGWTVITVLGLAYVTYNIAYVLSGYTTPLELATSWIGPMVLTVAIGVLALKERDSATDTWPRGDVLAAWFLAGSVLFAFAVVATLLVQAAEGAVVHSVGFAAVNWAAAGGTVGLLVGWYDLSQRAERRRVERTQAEVERHMEQLSVLNRVLRHDIRTAMNLVIGYADALESGTDDAAAQRIRQHANGVVDIADQARRMADTVQAGERERVDIAPHLSACLTEVGAEHPDVSVDADVPTFAPVDAYPPVTGVFDIAFDAALTGDVDSLAVTCEKATVDGREFVETVLVDDGTGAPDTDRLVLEEGESPLLHATGMGLWTAKWTVEECHGDFTFDSLDDRNRTTIRLPASRDESE